MNDKKTINRLKELREQKGLTQGQLAEAVGTSIAQISRLEKGERNGGRMLDVEWLDKLAYPLQVSPVEIISYPASNDCREVPVIGEVPGGDLREAIQSPAAESVLYPTKIKDIFALRVRGNSVNRIAPDGSFAIINHAEKERSRLVNQLVVVGINRHGAWETTCKIYKTNPDRFEPHSTEPHDTIFPGSDDWEIYGKVIGAISFADNEKMVEAFAP